MRAKKIGYEKGQYLKFAHTLTHKCIHGSTILCPLFTIGLVSCAYDNDGIRFIAVLVTWDWHVVEHKEVVGEVQSQKLEGRFIC